MVWELIFNDRSVRSKFLAAAQDPHRLPDRPNEFQRSLQQRLAIQIYKRLLRSHPAALSTGENEGIYTAHCAIIHKSVSGEHSQPKSLKRFALRGRPAIPYDESNLA